MGLQGNMHGVKFCHHHIFLDRWIIEHKVRAARIIIGTKDDDTESIIKHGPARIEAAGFRRRPSDIGSVLP